MKKILLMLLMLSLTTACTKEEVKKEKPKEKETTPIVEEQIVEEEYIDDNPIKLSFYLQNGGIYERKTEYYDPYQAYTDIDWFNVFLTEDNTITNSGVKNTWYTYFNKYQNINDYRIGYEVKFKLKNGKEFLETVTKPKNVYGYSFSEYVYIWVYDDANATASWYRHLEPGEENENTLLTSIKLMATELTHEIDGPIYLTVFTYNDEEDFDETGKYRGISKATLEIKAQ